MLSTNALDLPSNEDSGLCHTLSRKIKLYQNFYILHGNGSGHQVEVFKILF